MKKVSIVVPVYNMGNSLEKCVESLLNQTYGNYEIILVNDGSKDNSGEVCDKLAAENQIVQVVHTENRGSGPARNAGIDAATGGYIYFPDADDYLEPNAIARMVEAMETEDCDLVVFGFRYVNQDGNVVRTKTYADELQEGANIRQSYLEYMTMDGQYGIQGAPWNKFFDLRVIKENGIEYPPLRRHQDDGFIGRYMCHAKKVHFIEDVLYTYYTNDLQKEWQKYPVDYIDAVIGLYQVRKETICTWNPEDTMTHEVIRQEFICNVIKSLELSFMPKMALKGKARKEWIMTNVPRCGLENVTIPEGLNRYHGTVLRLLLAGKYGAAINFMHFKVAVEKAGFLDTVKKLIRH